MKDLGYGKEYKYAHNYRDAFIAQEYLPERLIGQLFYTPAGRGYEKTIKQRLENWRSLREKQKQAEEKDDSGENLKDA